MILYYLDSSAWVKRYCRESGSQWVQQLFQEGNNVACATLGVIEVLAALARKGKAGMIGDRIVKEAYAATEGDWASFVQVRLTDDILLTAQTLAKELALRGADVVHLASALSLYGRLNDEHDR